MHLSSTSAKPTTKGHGLKKWRRIKRDFVKEPTAVADGSKTLKRGYSGSENPTHRPMASTEIKQNSEPRLKPVNTSKNANATSGFMIHSPCSDSTENSEDRSNKSSTASGMPKVLPTILGYVHRRNHMKNFGGMSGGNSSPRVQQGGNSSPRVQQGGNSSPRVQQGSNSSPRFQQGSNSSPRVQLGSNSSPRVQQVKDSVESSKKLRGERVKIEKEGSLSSIGSDSRSSNVGFMSSPFSMASNLKQSGNSLNLYWKNDDEAHEGEDQINEEVQHAYRKENSGEIEELPPDDSAADLSREAKAQESESRRLSLNQDRLVNSILSLQSYSRSSNVGFMSSPFSMASNLKQSGNSLNLYWKNDDEAHEGEDQINEEVQNAYKKENSGEIEELPPDDSAADLPWDAKAQESESHRLSPNQDRLVNSILSLQYVQEALESELHKFEEIGKEPTSSDDGAVNMENLHTDSTFADRLNSEKISCTSGSLETQLFTLTHKVTYLESKLEEARALLRQDKYRETEFELEDLFLQRMETEIELLALTRAVRKLRVNESNLQTTVFRERTSSTREQVRLLNNLGEKKKYGKYYRDAIGTKKVLKRQRRVWKAALCIFTQLVLLVLVFLFVVLQLTPFSGMDVPT